MKISLPQVQYAQGIRKSASLKDQQTTTSPFETQTQTQYSKLSGYEVPFGAIKGIKPPKADFLAEKFKLAGVIQAKIDEAQSYSKDNIIHEELNKISSRLKKDMKKYMQSNFTFSKLENNWEEIREEVVTREMEKWEDELQHILDRVEDIIAERKAKDGNDYNLLHKLHKSLMSGEDVNLFGVYDEYYSHLGIANRLSQVKRLYPKIKLPPSPHEVLGKKIASTLDKDTAADLIDYYETKGGEVYPDKLREVGVSLCKRAVKNNGITDPKIVNERVLENIISEINEKILEAYGLGSLSKIPSTPLQAKITPEDLQLMKIDYDKYVISTLRQMYLEGKKLAEITYQEGDTLIRPKDFRDTQYRFEKPDETIKSYLKKGQKIRDNERNYDRFNNDQLQSRLKHYGNSELAQNEEILNKLIEFDSSQFTKEDRAPLIRFLRILDDINDKKITLEEGAKQIKEENLSPHGTIKLDKAEKEQKLNELKLEQQKNAEFKTYCTKYDNTTEELYRLNLTEAGSISSTYRPREIDDARSISDKILEIVEKYRKDGNIENTQQLENEIKYLNEYFEKKIYESSTPLLERATEFAKRPDGTVDEVKAGHYLANAKITTENFRELFGKYDKQHVRIIETIHNRFSEDKAIEALVKFDDFLALPAKEQIKISTILGHFDLDNDATQKPLVEAIVNNIYLKDSTFIDAALNKDQTKFVEAEMTQSAKAAIIKDKKFPLCLEYFELFERAMGKVAQAKEEDGIQAIGANNKTLQKMYKQEVKISKDERLYSSEGNYKFDIYKPGLHKNKNIKA